MRGCSGTGSSELPIRIERQLAGRILQIALEELEQLVAALVLVDAADIHGKRAANLVLLAEPRRLRVVRHVRSDADDDAGDLLVAGDGVNHRPLFGRVVHHRADAAEQRLEDRQADRGVALGGRHEDRARAGGARAVVGVVVAVAEEQAVVVARRRVSRRSRSAPGWSGPRRRASRARRRANGGAGRRDRTASPNTQRIALVLHAEPADRHAVDCLDAGRQLVAPRHVVGRAGRQHLDLAVTREVLGDVARVQLGAAVDRLAVALNDDRDLHCASGSDPAGGSCVDSAAGASAGGEGGLRSRWRFRRRARPARSPAAARRGAAAGFRSAPARPARIPFPRRRLRHHDLRRRAACSHRRAARRRRRYRARP